MNWRIELKYPTLSRGGASLLTATAIVIALAILGSGLLAQARSFEPAQDKAEAAKVAKKVERAKGRAAKVAKHELEAVRDFTKRLDRYARLHNNHLARLGGQTAVTAQALAEAIARERAKAKLGDVIIPEVQPLLRRLIAEQLKGPDTAAARKAAVEGNPNMEVESLPVVSELNVVYSAGATRATMPPSLLLALPPLPECLHYRFVGRDLLLVDSVAQIIVDILRNAAPVLGGK